MAVPERKIVHIDEDKCNGCGLCVTACHESAIHMVDGKARLVSDIYCDGLGDCLAPCPTGAISIITRAAEDFDADAVAARMAAQKSATGTLPCGCPGMAARALKQAKRSDACGCGCDGEKQVESCGCDCGSDGSEAGGAAASQLMNWPVQLRLIPSAAPYLKGADILLAADCAPVAVPDLHRRYLKNRPVIIACPKLDENAPQIAKLAEIIRAARPASLTVLRMEVPCCGGLVTVAEQAVRESGLDVPVRTVVVGVEGGEVG